MSESARAFLVALCLLGAASCDAQYVNVLLSAEDISPSGKGCPDVNNTDIIFANADSLLFVERTPYVGPMTDPTSSCTLSAALRVPEGVRYGLDYADTLLYAMSGGGDSVEMRFEYGWNGGVRSWQTVTLNYGRRDKAIDFAPKRESAVLWSRCGGSDSISVIVRIRLLKGSEKASGAFGGVYMKMPTRFRVSEC